MIEIYIHSMRTLLYALEIGRTKKLGERSIDFRSSRLCVDVNYCHFCYFSIKFVSIFISRCATDQYTRWNVYSPVSATEFKYKCFTPWNRCTSPTNTRRLINFNDTRRNLKIFRPTIIDVLLKYLWKLNRFYVTATQCYTNKIEWFVTFIGTVEN